MTPTEYQQRALRTVVQLTQQEMLGLCALGLAGELGEVIELIDAWLFAGHPLDPEKMQTELGDVLWYGAVLCATLGFPVEQVMQSFTPPFEVNMGLVCPPVFRASIEVGKVCDVLKKSLYHRNGELLDRERVEVHLTTLVFSLVYVCSFVGITLEQAMIANIAKLEARHQNGFTARYASDSHASESEVGTWHCDH